MSATAREEITESIQSAIVCVLLLLAVVWLTPLTVGSQWVSGFIGVWVICVLGDIIQAVRRK
jgi:membrane-bound metal-dependent hydrolase YbcI (DUF457 family)